MNVNSLFLMYLFTSDGGDSPRTHGASIVESTSWNISSLYFLEFFFPRLGYLLLVYSFVR